MSANIQRLHTDQQLLTRLQNDDKLALEILFKTYYAPLVRFAKNILKNKEQAEDIVQEVFLKIWDKRNEIKITTSFKAYLYMAVRNACFNTLKINERKYWLNDDLENDEQFSVNEIAVTLEAKELNQKINRIIDLLPEKCRITFQLSRFENMSYKEIAESMNVSVKTVENQIGKALSILRNSLSPHLSLFIFIADFIFKNIRV